MNKKIVTYLFSLAIIAFSMSCGSDSEIPAVCMSDKANVLSKPSKKEGKVISSISLGEKLMFLDDKEEDEKGKTYIKVKLLDGNEGWILSDLVAINAKPAVILEKVDIYSRPDLSSLSKKSFEEMDIIAISSKKDDWLEVVGKRNKAKNLEKAWIKDKGYSEGTTDIAVAVLINRVLQKNNKTEKLAELNAIINNENFEGTTFRYVLINEIRKLDPNAFPETEFETEDYHEESTESVIDSLSVK